nr:VaFE repeat-containing surface-anchored protein [Corynebacterium aurimucosum]
MSKLRNISREGWMVLTAVFTAIAVIAAMVTVPWTKAGAAEPTDFKPNMTMGEKTDDPVTDTSWGPLVWAGKPASTYYHKGNKANNVGWAWCIDATASIPMQNNSKYDASTAVKAPIPEEFRDAAINVAMKQQDALKRNDKAAVRTYAVYLAALLGSNSLHRKVAALTITGDDYKYNEPFGNEWYPYFKNDGGSAEEFKQLTGFEIKTTRNSDGFAVEFVRDPSVMVPKAPEGAYITIIGPDGKPGGDPHGQRVMPPDQPGLPDDESVEPSIGTQAKFAEGSTQVVAGAKVEDTVTYEGLVPGKKYTLNAELISKKDGKTVLGEGEKTFTPETANGKTVVEITVDESVKEPVEAAVAFE